MKMLKTFLVTVALCFASAGMAAEVYRLSKDDAAALVQKQTRGRVLSVDRAVEGRPSYRVKVVLPSGEVRVVHVDGQSGAVGH